jgi:hypothetical protein
MSTDGSKVEAAEDENQISARRPTADKLALVTVEDLMWLEAWKRRNR